MNRVAYSPFLMFVMLSFLCKLQGFNVFFVFTGRALSGDSLRCFLGFTHEYFQS